MRIVDGDTRAHEGGRFFQSGFCRIDRHPGVPHGEFRGLADLAGKKIALVTGTSNEQAVTNIVRQLSIIVTLVPVKNRDEAVTALEDGKVDAFASDKLLLAGAKFKDEDAFVILPDDLSIEQYAITLPRGDWALRLAVNTGLAHIYRSGRTKDLFERWFFGAHPGLLLDAVYALGGSRTDARLRR